MFSILVVNSNINYSILSVSPEMTKESDEPTIEIVTHHTQYNGRTNKEHQMLYT